MYITDNLVPRALFPGDEVALLTVHSRNVLN